MMAQIIGRGQSPAATLANPASHLMLNAIPAVSKRGRPELSRPGADLSDQDERRLHGEPSFWSPNGETL